MAADSRRPEPFRATLTHSLLHTDALQHSLEGFEMRIKSIHSRSVGGDVARRDRRPQIREENPVTRPYSG